MSEFGPLEGCRNRGTAFGVRVASIGGYRGSVFFTVDTAGTVAMITLRTLARGRYRYRLWLSDSPDDPRESLPPANVDSLSWNGITDEDGVATIRVEYNSAKKTYYPWVELVPVTVSDGFEIGTL